MVATLIHADAKTCFFRLQVFLVSTLQPFNVGAERRRGGAELARFVMPDAETVANISTLRKKYGEAMPYFFTQDPDYLELKNRVVQSVVNGKEPEGVASIDVAIETLKVAEYLTPILQEQLK